MQKQHSTNAHVAHTFHPSCLPAICLFLTRRSHDRGDNIVQESKRRLLQQGRLQCRLCNQGLQRVDGLIPVVGHDCTRMLARVCKQQATLGKGAFKRIGNGGRGNSGRQLRVARALVCESNVLFCDDIAQRIVGEH